MRVADIIANFIYDEMKVPEVFMLTGGGAMFLNDSIAKHPKLSAVLNHHEQACAMGAVGYAKYTNNFGVAYVTTGCGGTNAMTGVLDAWQDSTPCMFISGQVKKKETVYNSNLPLRQYGVQEADIVAVVKPITKYSIMINEPEKVLYHMQKAAYLAKSGRPGPVWIDVPLDVQGANINEKDLKHFNPNELDFDYKIECSKEDIEAFKKLLFAADRPVVLAGNGVRLGNSIANFKSFVKRFDLPTSVTYLGVDLLTEDNENYVGRMGIKGDRAGNFAVQNSDLVIVLGSRLSVAVTGFEYNLFAREAKIVVVDIDPHEHMKNTVNIDLYINSDLNHFFNALKKEVIKIPSHAQWSDKCRSWKEKWPVSLEKYETDEKINKYTFIKHLIKYLKKDTAVVSDAGSSYYVTSQALKIFDKQRYITSGAQADMGFTIPAAIGACMAKKGEVVAITGDGSFQMNIQELQTIVHSQMPIKLFVWNNNGYLSIRTTQRKFFDGREIGTDKDSGISFPELEKIAYAYGIPFFKANAVDELDDVLKKVMGESGPVICEIMCPENQEIIPTVASMKREDGTMVSKPIEDMYPFLDRDEFESEMIIQPVAE